LRHALGYVRLACGYGVVMNELRGLVREVAGAALGFED
jgi:hypothetical protein